MQLKSFGGTEAASVVCQSEPRAEVVRDDEWSDITRNNVQRRALYFTLSLYSLFTSLSLSLSFSLGDFIVSILRPRFHARFPQLR